MFVYRIYIYPKCYSVPRSQKVFRDYTNADLMKVFDHHLSEIGIQHENVEVKYMIGTRLIPEHKTEPSKYIYAKQEEESSEESSDKKNSPFSFGKASSKRGYQKLSFFWHEMYKRSEITLNWPTGKIVLNVSVSFEVKKLYLLKNFLKFRTQGFPYQISLFEIEKGSDSLLETRYYHADYLPQDSLEGKEIIIIVLEPSIEKGYVFQWMKTFREASMIEMYSNALKSFLFQIKTKKSSCKIFPPFLVNPFDNPFLHPIILVFIFFYLSITEVFNLR